MSSEKESPRTFRWIINTVIALFAAGGGIVALLTWLEQHYYWPFEPKTTIAVPNKPATDSSAQPAAVSLPADTWFVYLITDSSQGGHDASLREARRIEAELAKRKLNLPVRIYARADGTRWAVAVGDPLPADDAQQLLNRVVRSGYTQAARNTTVGWKLVQ